MNIKTSLKIICAIETVLKSSKPSGLSYTLNTLKDIETNSEWEIEITFPKKTGFKTVETLGKIIRNFSSNIDIKIDWEKRQIILSTYSHYYDKEINEKLSSTINDLELGKEEEE